MIDRTLSPLPRRSRQRGATLLVTLVFVIVLSLLGIGAAQNNRFQELMSGSTRDRELAFESAEAALQDAKATFGTWRTLPFNGTNGLSLYNAGNPNSAGSPAALRAQPPRNLRWYHPQAAAAVRRPQRVKLAPTVGAQSPRLERSVKFTDAPHPTVFARVNWNGVAEFVALPPDALIVP